MPIIILVKKVTAKKHKINDAFFCQKSKNVLFFNSYAQKTTFFYISHKNLVCSPIIVKEQASKENYLPHEISTLLAVFLLIDLLD
ncbi:hypothetical protein A6E74_10705 [Enterococcus thailandicus]|uniref:Uncharacterized protein n=1 Tax=Enterococcus thailandicus TaxID=417368 RepID=A0A179EP67_ENTTH|nr:hypothetical protein A6E74_10705 [Enterococcus thailandicus]